MQLFSIDILNGLAKLTILTIFVHESEIEFVPKLNVKQLKLQL